MSRRYRRKKNNFLSVFFTIILIFLIGLLCYKIYTEQVKPKDKNNKVETKEKETIKTNKKKNDDDKNESFKSTKEITPKKSTEITTKSSSNEKTENKNEQTRKGGMVKLELIGEESVTISKGSSYNDAGVKATYSDGSDASNEVEIDNAVDTSKEGTYTVSYYAGNAVVIRRVTVE